MAAAACQEGQAGSEAVAAAFGLKEAANDNGVNRGRRRVTPSHQYDALLAEGDLLRRWKKQAS